MGRLVPRSGHSIGSRRECAQTRHAAELSLRPRDLVLRACRLAAIAKIADVARVFLHRRVGVARERERRGETPVCREVARVQADGLAEKTDRRGALPRFGERGRALAKNAHRARTVLLLEVDLREPAIAALGTREFVDEIFEALLGLAQSPLLEALEPFFESDLVVEVLRSHRLSLRSGRAFGLALRALSRLSGALQTRLPPRLG